MHTNSVMISLWLSLSDTNLRLKSKLITLHLRKFYNQTAELATKSLRMSTAVCKTTADGVSLNYYVSPSALIFLTQFRKCNPQYNSLHCHGHNL